MHMYEQYVFVQYYNFIPEEAVPSDGVDKKLNCIRLKLDQQVKSEHEREQRKVFALCPVDSICGPVQVISSYSLFHFIYDTLPYKKAPIDHLNSPTEWENEIFYVNRFFHN